MTRKLEKQAVKGRRDETTLRGVDQSKIDDIEHKVVGKKLIITLPLPSVATLNAL